MSSENYSRQKPESWVDKLALRKRLVMLSLFLKEFPEHTIERVLDVGVTADANALSSNYFEKYFPNPSKITALSNQEAKFLESVYSGLTFKQGDARQLPFADNSMDVVFSSAVIEHLGSDKHQQTMLAECVRVAKRGVFITTPNRWHPIEVHTLIPLLHWLPKRLHRAILRKIGLSFYANEDNLNLLDAKSLTQFCQQLNIKDFSIKRIKTMGFTSNLILVINK